MATDQDTPPTVDRAEYDKLQSKYDQVRAQVEDLTRKFSGIDPEKAKADAAALLQLQKEGAAGDPKKIETLLAQREAELRKELAKEIDTHKQRADQLGSRVKELEVTDKVFAIAAGRFNDDTHEDVKAKIRQFCDLGEDGQIIVKDDKGKPRYSTKNPSAPMSPAEFTDWLVEQRPSWAKPTMTSGVKDPGQKVPAGNFANIRTLDDVNRQPNPKEFWAQLPMEKKREIAETLKF